MVSIINNMTDTKTSYVDIVSKRESRSYRKVDSYVYEVRIEEDIQPFFPYSPAMQYRFTNVSMYSSGNVEQSLFTADLLSSYFEPNELVNATITDGTSCIGGNTWAFASTFGRVNAVEIDSLHMSVLQHNLKQLGLYNINYYQDNYISQIGKLRQDVLFLDPPWGGMKYIHNPQIGLWSPSGVFYSVPQLLQLLPSSDMRVICFKLPRNYLTQYLRKLGYPYKRVISLKTEEGAVLYKLVLFSKIPFKREVKMEVFQPLRYKKIKYTKI